MRAGTTPLTLRALPSLLTDCVIVGHAKKADVVFTPPEWFAMCAHMHNERIFSRPPVRGFVEYLRTARKKLLTR